MERGTLARVQEGNMFAVASNDLPALCGAAVGVAQARMGGEAWESSAQSLTCGLLCAMIGRNGTMDAIPADR